MVGYKHPPSIERSREVAAAFEAKVAILEEWARQGVPEQILMRAGAAGKFKGSDFPRTHAQLRCWRGPNGDLATWSDPLIDRPRTGKHPIIADRFRAALSNIDRWFNRKRGVQSSLETRVAVLQAENDRLRIQNLDLLGELQQLQEDLALSRTREAASQR